MLAGVPIPIILVVAGAVVAGAAVLIYWRFKRRILDLTIALVGFEASGKTVYSGSMFHEMRVPGAEGIFLHADPKSSADLVSLYNQTADVDSGFPDSTTKADIREWLFTVRAKSNTGVTDVARFCYLDFAGESLRELTGETPNPFTRKLRERFERADILTGVLDGLEVRRHIEGNAGPRFYNDLGSLLALLANHKKAVNFVLTKWDIIEDDYDLTQVSKGLLQIENFSSFVQSQQIVGGCRLIPVSSVGHGFVTVNGDLMQKNEGRHINPERVEIPIACALPDAVTAQAHTRSRSRLLRWARSVKVSLSLPLVQVDIPLRSPQLYTSRTPAHIRQLLDYCRDRTNNFEREFPDSNLIYALIRSRGQ